MNAEKEKSAVGMAVPATETYKESIVSITDFLRECQQLQRKHDRNTCKPE